MSSPAPLGPSKPHPQTLEQFGRFKAEMRRFRGVWRSARIRLMIANTKDGWTLAFCRIYLQAGPVQEGRGEWLAPTSDLLAIDQSVSLAAVWKLVLHLVRRDRLPLWLLNRHRRETVLLRLEENTWQLHHLERPGWEQLPLQGPGTVFSRNGGPLLQTIDTGVLVAADRKMGLKSASYHSIKDWARQALPGLVFHDFHTYRVLQVISELPITCSYDHQAGVLRIVLPSCILRGAVQLSVFFESAAGAHMTPTSGDCTEQDGTTTWSVPISWPAGERTASTQLYLDDERIDQFFFKRYKGTTALRRVIDEYFDPDQAILLRWLRSSKAEEFEQGVVRLLTVLGLTVSWYGAKIFGERPDAAALVEERSGLRVALLLECTYAKPDQKLTPLLGRVARLQELLQDEAIVVPVLFVAGAVSSRDLELAAVDKILLADEQAIQSLLRLTADEPSAARVLQVLRTRGRQDLLHSLR